VYSAFSAVKGFFIGLTTMHIEHAALWTTNLQRLTDFYVEYFEAVAGPHYINPRRQFESCFLSFAEGARLEIMTIPTLAVREGDNPAVGAAPHVGAAHLAFATGSEAKVDALTERLRAAGYAVMDGPRRTGDGYYESVILDPDGNRVEITV
jgi:lactoylglutathione lyase